MSKREEDFFNEATKQIRYSYVFQNDETYSDDDVRDIATSLAEHGYQYAVEKACEFMRLHIGVDIPVKLNPDGEPLAEDFINQAEARVNAANKVVEQFKQFMEE